MKHFKAVVGVVLLSASATLVSAAPPPWIEIKSPHFTVIGNSGEKAARRTAWQFEQIRQALLVIWPWANIDGGRSITIFAVRDEATLKTFGPQYWEGKRYRPASFWVGGDDRHYIALRTDLPEPDDAGENPYQSVYWNYVSLVRPTNERIAATLQKAIDLEPDFANALSFLADTKEDLGEFSAAMDLAQRAVRIEPESSYHRMALARAQWGSSRTDEAIATARGAMRVADSDEEKAYVQRFLDFAAKAPRPAPRLEEGTTVVGTAAVSPAATGTPRAVPIDASTTEAVTACIEKHDDALCAKAVPPLRASCEKNDGYACRALGSLYDGGFGVPTDKVRAGAAYDRGCRVGADKASCARYAVLQMQGLGVQRDSAAGLATLESLCGEKVDDACVGWALILAGRPEKRDVPKARALLHASCENGNTEGCRLLKSLPAR